MNTLNTDPHCWTAIETLAALRSGRIGAVELLDHSLARKDRLNPAINAVVETNVEAARQAAREADMRHGEGRPLNGLPMTIKDTFEVAGFHTTAGIPDLAEYAPLQDADAVARLKAAGAVIYGKTCVPVAASDHQSYNPIHGVSRNPWNLERTVGGSSGGAAAALAAGLTPLELGSDIGGSIRIPSHFCGVWGHKSSYGIVPSRGHIPPGPGMLSTAPLAVCGPLARCTADLELALSLLAGSGPGDAWTLTLPRARHQRRSDFRVAVWTDGFPADPAYIAAITDFGKALANAGVPVTHVSTPAHLKGTEDLYMKMLIAVISAGASASEIAAYEAAAREQSASYYAGLFAHASQISFTEYGVLLERQAQLIAGWKAWFADYDILLCPVSMTAAFLHKTDDGYGVPTQLQRTLKVGDEMRPYLDNLQWPGVATLGHLPVTVRPLPEKLDGLPAGVQIIGPGLEDRTPLAFAAHCDAIFGGFTPPPGYE